MNEQYFSNNPQSKHNEKQIRTIVNGIELKLMTDSGVFSKDRVDFGSQRLIETFSENVNLEEGQSVLELGSGYGPILITLAKAHLNVDFTGVELNERAFELAKRNAELNKVGQIKWVLDDATTVELGGQYDFVLTNPPIRAGKKSVHEFITHAYKQLKPNGSLWVVIQKKQGAPSLLNHMEDIFRNVTKVKQDKGYWILMSEKEV
ncbi:class I SAM-dependent methyltransferase [Aerococcaceae bacterium DSM 111021]|nr:class I SAM-dependent methyltransferase [Aerococcaceae bacterium DSM 111021]